MSRWEPNAMGRLEQAALDLYQERGFEQTMVTEIAERAGLTERTFFRYFADKREVRFGGQDILRQVSVSTLFALFINKTNDRFHANFLNVGFRAAILSIHAPEYTSFYTHNSFLST